MNIVLDAFNTYSSLIISIAIYLVFAIFLGIFFDKIALQRLQKFAAKTKFAGDDIVIEELKGKSMPFFIIAALYWAIISSGLEEQYIPLIKKVFIVIAVILLTFIAAKIISRMVRVLNQENNSLLPTSSIITNIANIIVIIIGLLVVLQTLGISIAPLLTALGVGGLAVALALQDTLSNLFSGIQIIISKKINPGDYIKLDNGDAGYVTDITWRNTTIRALQNNVMVVPNSKVASSIITNYALPEKEMAFSVDVGVSYDSDLEKVEKVALETALEVMKTVAGGVPDCEPSVRFHSFSDYSIVFSVGMRGQEFTDQYLLKHEFIKKLHKRFQKEKIEIPFPISTVNLKKS